MATTVTAVEETPKYVPRKPGLGMHLDGKVVAELARRGLSARPNVYLAHQKKQDRWVIVGEEGGGSVGDVGHYTGYVGVAPEGLSVSIPTQSLIPNSCQRRAISPQLVRAQLFRYSNSCNLLVTRHYLEVGSDGKRTLQREVLFQGLSGILADKTKQPVFFDYAGEAVDFPPELIPLIQAVSKGATTAKNHIAHCITLEPVVLPPVPPSRFAVTPVVEGEPLAIEGPSSAPPATEPPIGKFTRRKRSAAQLVVPQPTVAQVEASAQLAV